VTTFGRSLRSSMPSWHIERTIEDWGYLPSFTRALLPIGDRETFKKTHHPIVQIVNFSCLWADCAILADSERPIHFKIPLVSSGNRTETRKSPRMGNNYAGMPGGAFDFMLFIGEKPGSVGCRNCMLIHRMSDPIGDSLISIARNSRQLSTLRSGDCNHRCDLMAMSDPKSKIPGATYPDHPG
jgi:hypothetical protein